MHFDLILCKLVLIFLFGYVLSTNHRHHAPNSNNFENYPNWIEFGWNVPGPTITVLLEIDTEWIGKANFQRTFKPFFPIRFVINIK